MDDKIDEVIKKYPVKVTAKRRIRGAILLEAKEGTYTLVNYRDSARKLLFQEKVKSNLIEKGYLYVDQGIPNENGEYLTKDPMGNRWLMKRWYVGRECNLRDDREILRATKHMAQLHQLMRLEESVDLAKEQEAELLAAQVEEFVPEAEDFVHLSQRHMREMKRVYNYIRSKRRKNEIELSILNMFSRFYDQAGAAGEHLKEMHYEELLQACRNEQRVIHGSYNYHNILFLDREIATTNFEKAQIGIQITDLYDFLRKIMEKNNWNLSCGLAMIDAYEQVRPLEKQEARLLYVLLLFPEKFWKQINFYYNGKKSWMSLKNYDKLLKLEKQETDRRNFLNEAKSLLF